MKFDERAERTFCIAYKELEEVKEENIEKEE